MIRASLASVFVLAILASPAGAQSPSRERSEFYAGPVFTPSRNESFDGGTTARSDAGGGLALGYAYNFDQRKSLGVETLWTTADYRATVQPGAGNANPATSISGSMDTWTVRLLGNYYFPIGGVAPFVTGALGWTYIDTKIPPSLPQNVCWYYPWAGLSCGPYSQTRTSFSYSVGAGLRKDFGERFFARALMNEQWADVGGSYSTIRWTQYRVDLGVSF